MARSSRVHVFGDAWQAAKHRRDDVRLQLGARLAMRPELPEGEWVTITLSPVEVALLNAAKREARATRDLAAAYLTSSRAKDPS